MDALTLLAEARKAGLAVLVEGDRLRVRGPRRAEAIAKKLLALKPAVVQALAAQGTPAVSPSPGPRALPPDWFVLWDERAAIMEYDGKMSREHAEARALADVLRLMRESSEKPRG